MYTIDFTAVIAIALVALTLVAIRISWTLKELVDALSSGSASRGASAPSGNKADAAASPAKGGAQAASADAESAGPDETELAAVIAIAHEAFRAAV